MPIALAGPIELTDTQFDQIRDMVRQQCGIHLHDGKKQLVKGRLAKRLRELHLESFRQYIEHLGRDGTGGELVAMLDAISTNQTSFFREAPHFDMLRDAVLPRLAAGSSRRMRVWSAGCSSGEEPYSIAITLREALEDASSWDIRILATDISTRVLATARRGEYGADRLSSVPPIWRSRWFGCTGSRSRRMYRVREDLRGMVTFARLNLMGPWPMSGPFDVIFCRNVMIYFDRPTRERLVRRFSDLLAPGGTFFVGHSESLTGIDHGLRYVQPTVYRRPCGVEDSNP